MTDILKKHRLIGIRHTLRQPKNAGLPDGNQTKLCAKSLHQATPRWQFFATAPRAHGGVALFRHACIATMS